MINFSEKQTLNITAARCVGLLKSMYLDPCRDQEHDQLFFESEYFSLYAMLQDLSFNSSNGLRWSLLSSLEKHEGVYISKSEFGFTLSYNEMNVEVTPKNTIDAGNGTIREVRTLASELRNLTVETLNANPLVQTANFKHLDWSRV